MRLGKISVVAVLAAAAAGLMTTTGLAQSSSKSSTVSNREAPPFDPGLWETFYLDGRKYWCNQLPDCSIMVSYALEKIEGELDPAFEKEIEKQRAISTIPKRQLLSFDTEKRANDPRLKSVYSNWPSRAALTMSWRDGTEDATNVRFGSLRIVYERNTKILVLVTSSNLDAARKTEIAVSKSLGIFP